VMAHEPPFLCLLDGDPRHAALARRRRAGVETALAAIRAGDHTAGARIFVESVTSAPGAWEGLPEHFRQEFVRNAAAFLAEGDSLDDVVPDLFAMAELGPRLVVTHGERSSPYFRTIAQNLLAALPRARSCVFVGAGHVPQQSHPNDFVAKTLALTKENP
jgi:pimeloyl-ACP methyl ester carboxylesterase